MSRGSAGPRLLLASLVLGGAGVVYWLTAPEAGDGLSDPGREAAESSSGPAPVALDRRPLEDETFAAPGGVDSLAGVELHWVELNNEATQLLAAGELVRAVALFEECYTALPERTVFRRNLAEALIRLARREHDDERRFEEAITHLERSVSLAPDREDIDVLRSILARWKDEWALAQSHTTELSLYFEISYDAARDDILQNSQEAIRFLDLAYLDMAEWFLADPVTHDGKPKFHVVLYNHAEFDRITGIGDWAGGVFDGTIRVSVEHLSTEAERWGRTLRHELTHAFIAEVGGADVPGWLNEGLAQYLDTSIDSNPHRTESVRDARARLRGVELFTLAELSGSLATWTDKKAITKAYAQSLALVDYLVREYGAEAARRMLAGSKSGAGVADAFQAYSGGITLDEAVEFLRSDLAR